MKRTIAVLAVTLLTLGFTSHASAWTYTVSGDYVCNTRTGQYDITWTVNNPEDEELTIQTSNRPSVPVGSEVLAKSQQQFFESVAGSETSAKLEIKVNWPSDQKKQKRVATITMNGDCKVPEKPTEVVPQTTPVPTPVPQPTPQPTPTIDIPPADMPVNIGK